MLVTQMQGDVEAVKVGTEVEGRVFHWVYLYYYKGLLFDTGCVNTAHEVFEHFREREIRAVLITHHHEDHIGAVNLFKRMARVFVPAFRFLKILLTFQNTGKLGGGSQRALLV